MRRLVLLAALILPPLLAGCEMLGIESPERIAAAREADGKAVGGACRHAGRAIEDCYALNRKAERAAVFAGWRDMNDYMRENKIEVVPPQGIATAQARVAEPPAEPAAAIEKQRPAKPGIDGIKPRPRSS
jgi:hypothetical protein